ncbi:MAG TPA: sugar ABC transporter ATP-binding protein [Cyanobacteria bacterium UBA11149]|nr:sugar ABC transporter ATP-binding protein [Cyanobacteria bacterium UBA11367]HBE60038.1 sugar ABC transporter ATP-binding protein [Cyanobacteria bacterium UBA11366]HBK63648.1 sugar ABC transporter ATP-binding protein [Cyanobacteria bacterium UBA11166]HBR75508.1 sugar ABC transporter ATP-binding protein [Cyanobacteria bacterium UBA11159]HBS71707.1 sugar ABC transporter ATP-binding protein [Cyanobacteria bacterium UBA11153]HBW88278.1 sugar ABC transporter ATP-binding protein [Cyanobacteria bac
MAQVTLENVYKSFPQRKGEETVTPVTLETLPRKDNPIETANPTPSGSVNILRRINLTVNDGEFMVLVGPSGCGKSTLLRTIAGLSGLTGGKIWVGDTLVNDLPPKARDIAMVFQNYALYPHLTVYDNIAFGLRRTKLGNNTADVRMGNEKGKKIPGWMEDLLVGMTRNLPQEIRYISEKEKAVDEQVRRVAQLLQIELLLNRLPKQLSGGQKQRVALGRAIARNPQVFLMDEPLSNLDAKLRAETRSQIVKLQRQLGTTTIYVTHDQTEAMTMGNRIAVMNRGEIQQIAPPLELYNHPANKFVAEFIGSPPMNFLMVLVKAPRTLHHPQFRLTLPEFWTTFLEKYDGLLLFLGIRPEHLILGVPAPKNLRVQVESVEALGNDTYISVALADSSTLQVRIPPDLDVKIGDQIWLSIADDKIHLFDPKTGIAIGANF